MAIFQNKYGEQQAYFVRYDHFGLEATQRFGHPVKDLRRLEITVELQDECEVWGVKAAVRAVCCVLSETYKLDYLRIKLDGRGHFNAQSFDRVLESSTLLRNVRKVVLDEVPPVYAKYLESKMTGDGSSAKDVRGIARLCRPFRLL
jgi:hypothetical protein